LKIKDRENIERKLNKKILDSFKEKEDLEAELDETTQELEKAQA